MTTGNLRTEEMILNMGPQHPSTHGVLRLELVTDGEVVTEAEPHIGYLHRCAEKIGENVNYQQFVPYTDRMDYLAGMNCNHAYAHAVERLMDLKVPERAEYIRILVLELNRIASHLVAFGTYGLDIGAFTPFFYAFRERERILDLFEELCGARLTYNYVRIGGVMIDLPSGWLKKVAQFLDYFEPKIKEYDELLSLQQDLHQAHRRRRGPAGRHRHRLRRDRAQPARIRHQVGSPERGAVLDLRPLRVRCAGGTRRDGDAR